MLTGFVTPRRQPAPPEHREAAERRRSLPRDRRAWRPCRGARLHHLPRGRAPLQRLHPLLAHASARGGGGAHEPAAAFDRGLAAAAPRPRPRRGGLRDGRRALGRARRAGGGARRLPAALRTVRPGRRALRGDARRVRRVAQEALDGGACAVGRRVPRAARRCDAATAARAGAAPADLGLGELAGVGRPGDRAALPDRDPDRLGGRFGTPRR